MGVMLCDTGCTVSFAPLNAYNADDDAPPQESLLDMSTSDATSLNITMSGRSLLHTRVSRKLTVATQ